MDFVSCICCLAVFSYYVDYIVVLILDLMDGGRSDCWEMLGASDHTNSYRDIQGLGLPLFGILSQLSAITYICPTWFESTYIGPCLQFFGRNPG